MTNNVIIVLNRFDECLQLLLSTYKETNFAFERIYEFMWQENKRFDNMARDIFYYDLIKSSDIEELNQKSFDIFTKYIDLLHEARKEKEQQTWRE